MINKIRMAVIGAAGYALLGAAYQLYREGTINSPGCNNTRAGREFLEEFENEADSLEKRLRAKNKQCDIEISTDIIVHSRAKSFFDDKNSADDNDRWAKEVEAALEGLNVYKGLGICFNYENVIPVYEDVLMYDHSLALEDLLNSPELLRHALLAEGSIPIETLGNTRFFYQFAGIHRENVFIFSAYYPEAGVYGKGELNGSFALVLLTNDSDYNSKVTAHEAGHLFGLWDAEEPGWVMDLIIDPFHLFTNIMSRGLISFSLDKGQIEEIMKNARQRFE